MVCIKKIKHGDYKMTDFWLYYSHSLFFSQHAFKVVLNCKIHALDDFLANRSLNFLHFIKIAFFLPPQCFHRHFTFLQCSQYNTSLLISVKHVNQLSIFLAVKL